MDADSSDPCPGARSPVKGARLSVPASLSSLRVWDGLFTVFVLEEAITMRLQLLKGQHFTRSPLLLKLLDSYL